MNIKEAVSKIEEMGFQANVSGNQICVSFNFKGSTKNCGFVSLDGKLSCPPCGKHTSKYQSVIDEINALDIEWPHNAKEEVRTVMASHRYAMLQAKREIETQDWEFSHNL